MKKTLILTLILIIFLSVFWPTPVSADLILTPEDDSWVDIFDNDINKDGSGLFTDYSNFPDCFSSRISYLRFNLAAINLNLGPLTVVRVYAALLPSYTHVMSLWSTVSPDWNGDDPGIGDETTLIWDNAPAAVSKLATAPIALSTGYIEFSGSDLANYINQNRVANGGTGYATFALQWDGCRTGMMADTMAFEDKEQHFGTTFQPQLYPRTPTAVTVQSLSARAQGLDFPAAAPRLAVIALSLLGLGLCFASRRLEAQRTRG